MIEYTTLERARQNMENSLQKVENIQNTRGVNCKAWQKAWNEYKQRASDYRSFLIVHYNL